MRPVFRFSLALHFPNAMEWKILTVKPISLHSLWSTELAKAEMETSFQIFSCVPLSLPSLVLMIPFGTRRLRPVTVAVYLDFLLNSSL